MAERNPPSWLQGGSHAAENDRLLTKAVLDVMRGGVGSTSGVVNDTNLLVTANGTPNMSVNVSAGGCFIQATEVGASGTYHCFNDATKNLTIGAADATNPRRDLVIARVRDAQYSGAVNAWALEVVQGVAAASPSDPVLPANSLLLARVAVAASASSISSGNITDLRTFLGQWTPFTPIWGATGSPPSLGNGTFLGRYFRIGKTVLWTTALSIGTTSSLGSGVWWHQFPWGNTRSDVQLTLTHSMVSDSSLGQSYSGTGFILAGSNVVYPQVLSTNGAYGIISYIGPATPMVFAAGDLVYTSGIMELA